MLEVSNLRVPLDRLDGTEQSDLAACRHELSRRLGIKPAALGKVELRRRSIDARKKSAIVLMYTVRVDLTQEREAEDRVLARAKKHHDKHVARVRDIPYTLPAQTTSTLERRPVVVGAGCAGLFCALALASAGLEPLLIEQGDDATRRSEAIQTFNQTGVLDPLSNIQFGLGGAGTFSDGKLSTGTKSPAHRLILQTFVDAGAPRNILWDAKPHVGSDILPTVVTNVCQRIRQLGGEVWMRSRLVDIALSDARVQSVTIERAGHDGSLDTLEVATSDVVLACGHSARDVFALLKRLGVHLDRKTFAMGVRIEHLQATIDRAQYGPSAGNPALGAAPYKLVAHLPQGRNAFSFCMCPGGYVVAAASEAGGVVTNGMSLSDRAGTNANAGLLANVFPTDLPGDDVLAGVDLQRSCEHRAFQLGGGQYRAPTQLVGDFLQDVPSSAPGEVLPTYPRGVSWGKLDECLPPYIVDTLRAAIPVLGRHLRGFDEADAVLTAPETRSSSPVRVTRGSDGQSVSTQGLWPCGEGAGYAGGIMSAATDGLDIAQAILRKAESGA